jgi:predicted nucleic acid-binding protein
VRAEIAVFDAGPLIAFHQIDHLDLLRGLFDQVAIPPEVAREVAPSIAMLPHWFKVQTVSTFPWFSRKLGPGERAAIALSVQLSADFVVLDDLDARSSAIGLGLTVIGSFGLLVRAKRRGLIREVRPMMDAMLAHGLFVSEHLCRQILALAGEPES